MKANFAVWSARPCWRCRLRDSARGGLDPEGDGQANQRQDVDMTVERAQPAHRIQRRLPLRQPGQQIEKHVADAKPRSEGQHARRPAVLADAGDPRPGIDRAERQNGEKGRQRHVQHESPVDPLGMPQTRRPVIIEAAIHPQPLQPSRHRTTSVHLLYFYALLSGAPVHLPCKPLNPKDS